MRNTYPRPNLKRKEWTNLNGEWEFAFDANYDFSNVVFDSSINVPFVYQTKLSGINTVENHDVVWYKKNFRYNKTDNVILHFGAVDYEAKVYLNGEFIGEHSGGSLPFSFDVTDKIKVDNELVVRVYDPSYDESIPRGKQFWKESPEACWYTRSTGIWQTVWIEDVSTNRISKIKFTPDVDSSSIRFEMDFVGSAQNVEVIISKDGQVVLEDMYTIYDNRVDREVNLLESHVFRMIDGNGGWLWSPENPTLFDVEIRVLKDKKVTDFVETYFGMRKVHFENGKFYLNNREYYLRLVLDQGYFPESLLTAPSDESFKTDVELSKKLGFNGCRKHQKVEEPTFLYECDKQGFIVWGEIPSAPLFNDKVVQRMTDEFTGMIERDYNHPSIIAWVCINESWGTPKIQYNKAQQAFSQGLYYIAKAYDSQRLALSNDGWSITKTDICAIHNYAHGLTKDSKQYEKFKKSTNLLEDVLKTNTNHQIYANGFEHEQNVPVMLTEFGGVAFNPSNEKEGWGYTQAATEDDFLDDLTRIMDAIYSSETLCGFCYTQITDVEQEINGLLNYDRSEKIDIGKIKRIICNENVL